MDRENITFTRSSHIQSGLIVFQIFLQTKLLVVGIQYIWLL